MKIFLICSKAFYDRIPPIKLTLEQAGHEVTLPNCFDDPGTEARYREMGDKEHAEWKASMLRHSQDVIENTDAVLVLNFEKNGQENYIGGATFLEMYDAFRMNKTIYMYNGIPDGMLKDEIAGFEPILLEGDVTRVNNSDIPQPARKDDLFRLSLKAVMFNKDGEVLVVKEKGRDWWDIPGGGMDHDESIKDALARELREEVSLKGDFEYETILTEHPRHLAGLNLYQMRITYLVKPEIEEFGPGEDSDEVMFIDPLKFKDSELVTERKIYEYCQAALTRRA